MTRRQFTPRPYHPLAMVHMAEQPRSAIFAKPGMGKSVMALTFLDHLHNVVGEDRPTLVLAPLRVARDTWANEAHKWDHLRDIEVVPVVGTVAERKAALRRDAPVYTTNYDNLVWLVETLGDRWPFATVVADECFIAGTMVDTTEGPKPIETLEPGTFVKSHLGLQKVINVFRKKTQALVAVQLVDGTRIVCTPSHLFWTQAGWKAAGELGRTDFLYSEVHAVRDSVRVSAFSDWAGRARQILQPVVYNKGVDIGKTKVVFPRYGTAGTSEVAGGKRIVEQRRSDAGKQQAKTEQRAQGSGLDPAREARREREGDEPCGGSAVWALGTWLGLEQPDTDKGAKGQKPAELLQTGLQLAGKDDLSGGGWCEPQSGFGEAQRREEGSGVAGIGVAGVSHIECPGGEYVWDIEVENAHTYFAAGVLVHNCTKLKGFRLRQGGKRAQALARVAHKHVDRWVNLTGTPASNGLTDLWGQTWFLDAGQRLGRTFSAFQDRWFRQVKAGNFHQWAAYDHAQEEIQQRLSDICLTLDPRDWFDMQEPIVNVIEVDLPPTARVKYREMERELFTMIESSPVEAANAAVKSAKLLQMCNGAVYLEGGKDWVEVHTEKLDALEELADQTGDDPLLVLYLFKSDKARLLRRFPDALDLATVDGLAAAQAGKGKLWLGHPASMGHGVDGLQYHCNTVVFFAQDWNLEFHDQALERVGPMRQLQAGKDRPVFLHYLVARNSIDELVMARRASKRSVQDLLLDYLKGKK